MSDENKPMKWHENFDKRQLKEIEFARLYAERFGHGTDGHNAKVIIARFAALLDEMEGIIEGLPREEQEE